MKYVSKNLRSIITLRFTEKIYIPEYSLVPTDHINVEVTYRELSRDNGKTWKYYLNFFTKPGSKTFYYPEFFPFTVISTISEQAQVQDGCFIKPSTSKRKPLFITDGGTNKLVSGTSGTNKIPLFSLLSKNSQKDRNESSCLLCNKQITTSNPQYVHLDSNGYLLNTLDQNADHYGFFKIGPECSKKLPPDFIFTYIDIAKCNSYALLNK